MSRFVPPTMLIVSFAAILLGSPIAEAEIIFPNACDAGGGFCALSDLTVNPNIAITFQKGPLHFSFFNWATDPDLSALCCDIFVVPFEQQTLKGKVFTWRVGFDLVFFPATGGLGDISEGEFLGFSYSTNQGPKINKLEAGLTLSEESSAAGRVLFSEIVTPKGQQLIELGIDCQGVSTFGLCSTPPAPFATEVEGDPLIPRLIRIDVNNQIQVTDPARVASFTNAFTYVAEIPGPATLLLVAIGLAGLAASHRRKT